MFKQHSNLITIAALVLIALGWSALITPEPVDLGIALISMPLILGSGPIKLLALSMTG
ncbi:hypothetical protein [Novosphingobium sp.]|uniref:hypothetical protein n=1 Tax=Novosphingobium sp. TaxID=1874826 RepID=UPI002BE6850A|nr:hypothetical protein [Novosphingobium sp.]HQV03093.1 hypothetical protein [Novosphingobium sp.]